MYRHREDSWPIKDEDVSMTRREYVIISTATTYHVGNVEQMQKRINAAHVKCIEDLKTRLKQHAVIVAITTSTAVDNECGTTVITLVAYRGEL